MCLSRSVPMVGNAEVIVRLRRVTAKTVSKQHSKVDLMKKCIAALVVTLLAVTGLFAQIPVVAPPKHFPWSDKTLSPDQRADMVIKEMTLDEKFQLVHGLGWQTYFAKPESGPGTRAIDPTEFIPGVPRLGMPDLQMTDSVVGVSGA